MLYFKFSSMTASYHSKFWAGLLLTLLTLLWLEEKPVEACGKNIKENIITNNTNTMNSSETEIINDIKAAYEILSQSEDPVFIAKKFGDIVTASEDGRQEVKPFNVDIESIIVSTDKFSTNSFYSAFSVSFDLKQKTKIKVSVIQKYFGEYTEVPRTHYDTPKTIAFNINPTNISPRFFTIGIDYEPDKDFSEAMIKSISVRLERID